MQISETMISLLKEQYVHELGNYNVYRSLAMWCEYVGLTGAAKFFKSQASGEQEHAEKVLAYIEDRNKYINLDISPLPGASVQGIGAALSIAMERETSTTAKLEVMNIKAMDEKDYLTHSWLVNGLLPEQIEEENVIQTLIDRCRATNCEGDTAALAAFDVYMGSL